MKIVAYIKKKYNKFIEYLISSNKKNFGGKPLDCCDLNKTSKQTDKT